MQNSSTYGAVRSVNGAEGPPTMAAGLTLLETIIAVLHHLTSGRRVGRHMQCNVMTV